MTINNTHQPRTMRTACGWRLVARTAEPRLDDHCLHRRSFFRVSWSLRIWFFYFLPIPTPFCRHLLQNLQFWSRNATESLLQFMDVIICKLQNRNRKYSWMIGNLHHASSDHLRFLMKSEPQPQPQDAVQLPAALSRALQITLLAVRCDICRDICTVYEEPQIIVSSPAGSLQEKVGLREQGAAAASTQHRDNMSHTFRDILLQFREEAF